MSALTRCRDPDAHRETWRIFFGDIHAGTISLRSGNPTTTDPWVWRCGFYPGSNPGECTSGTASSFWEARTAFERSWSAFLAKRTDEYRQHRAFTAWKYAMWDAGCKMPTQIANGRSRCFCGVAIDIETADQHIYAAHVEMT